MIPLARGLQGGVEPDSEFFPFAMDATHKRAAEPAPKRLLIIDDDSAVRAMLGRVLADEGYAVQSAGDGERALALAVAESFDLALLDLGLPPTDGWDVFSGLRTVQPSIPVIIITARCGEAASALSAGADALLEKPLDYPTLLGTIARVLAAPRMDRAPRKPLPFLHAKRDQIQ